MVIESGVLDQLSRKVEHLMIELQLKLTRRCDSIELDVWMLAICLVPSLSLVLFLGLTCGQGSSVNKSCKLLSQVNILAIQLVSWHEEQLFERA